MYPTLFHLGEGGLHSYGMAIALGFIVAILLAVRSGRRQGVSVDRILDLAFWILVSSLLGARLLFLGTEAQTYYRWCVQGAAPGTRTAGQVFLDCTLALHLWEGGLVFYGGFIGAVLASIWYTRRKGLGFLRVADLVIPVVALGHFFGRLGCFCAGCCYGKITASVVGVAFPPGSMIYQEMVRDGLLSSGAPTTPPVYPTQLFEAVAELGIYLVLLGVNRRKRYHGQALVAYLLLYPAVRFVLELFRADPDRHFVVALATPGLNRLLGLAPDSPSLLSTSQLVSVLLVLAAGVMLLGRDREQVVGTRARG
jgi:phosphatidylglycerol:prolipoprotein diacylglycerol transferase